MDETIGVKGGHNDRRKVLINIKKKKDKELKELEKKVKRNQKYTLIKTLPIVITGAIFKELIDNKTTKKNKIEKEKDIVFEDNKVSKKDETQEIIIILKNGKKKTIEIPIKEKIVEIEEEKKNTISNKTIENKKIQEKEIVKEEKTEIEEEKEKNEIKKVEKQEEISKKEKIQEEPLKEKKLVPQKEEEKKKTSRQVSKEKQAKQKNSIINIDELNDRQKNKFQKLQARKIIDVYEKQLKDIRYELRNLIIEYNTIVDEEDKIIKSKEEEKILDKLNQIIKKIEELKEKIRIEDLDKYDDNYIYTLIEGYLGDFKDKKIIKEIKDSPLYILISEKLDEFDKRKEEFKSKIDNKKETLEINEEKLEELKEKYLKLDKFNSNINSFYQEQEKILKQMQDKIDNATTVTEKVHVQVEYINKETTSLLKRLSLLMFIPGPKGAKALITMSSIYAMMARNMIRPKTITKRYKEVTVYDYSRDIKSNIKTIEEATNDLSKSSKNIDKLISQIKEEFSDYIGVIPECDELLSNLKKVKSNIEEKEYELEKIKSKQEKELERNNAKVLSIGTYPM